MTNSEATIAALFNQDTRTIQAWKRSGTLEGYSSRQVYDMVKRMEIEPDFINKVLWEEIEADAKRSLERTVYRYNYKGKIPTRTYDINRTIEWQKELGFKWGLEPDEGAPDEPIKRCHIKFNITANQEYNRPISDLESPLLYALKYGDIIKSVGSRCVLRAITDSQKCKKGSDIATVEVEEIF